MSDACRTDCQKRENNLVAEMCIAAKAIAFCFFFFGCAFYLSRVDDAKASGGSGSKASSETLTCDGNLLLVEFVFIPQGK